FAAKAIIFLLLLQQRRKRQKLKNDQPINTVADYQSGPNWLQKVVWELANHNLWNQPTMPLNLGGGMF
ncbi:MAG: hypothetical protein LBD41_07750, partial [Clostridiales Family XIII bacterium]|nr:hypothetical protein [Clostridiales Family XIII bacterium]